MESVGHSADELSVADLDLGPAANDDSARASLRRAHESLRQTVERFREDVCKGVGQALRAIGEIEQSGDAIRWREAVNDSQCELRGGNGSTRGRRYFRSE